MQRIAAVLLVGIAAAGCRGSEPSQPAAGGPVITQVLVNGRVWTGNPAQPEAKLSRLPASASWAVGTRRHPCACAGAEVVDLNGRFVVPGFHRFARAFRGWGLPSPRCSCVTPPRARSLSRGFRVRGAPCRPYVDHRR